MGAGSSLVVAQHLPAQSRAKKKGCCSPSPAFHGAARFACTGKAQQETLACGTAPELLREQGSAAFISAGLILATVSSAGRCLHCISHNPKEAHKEKLPQQGLWCDLQHITRR